MQAPMSRARYRQEHRKMRFEEAYQGWTCGHLTQAEVVKVDVANGCSIKLPV